MTNYNLLQKEFHTSTRVRATDLAWQSTSLLSFDHSQILISISSMFVLYVPTSASAIHVPVIPIQSLLQPSVTQRRQCSVSQVLSPRLRPLHRTQILNSPPTPCTGQTEGHPTNQSILLITKKTDSFLSSMGIYLSWWGKTYEESGHIKACLLWFTHINTQVLHRSNFFRGYWFAVHKNLFEEIRRRQSVVFRVAQHVTCPPRYISLSLTIPECSLFLNLITIREFSYKMKLKTLHWFYVNFNLPVQM